MERVLLGCESGMNPPLLLTTKEGMAAVERVSGASGEVRRHPSPACATSSLKVIRESHLPSLGLYFPFC